MSAENISFYPKNNGGVTDEQVKMWKAKHRKVVEVELQDDEETHVGYFKRADMETLAAANKLGKTDEIKAANALFENCWLGGSPLIREDASLKMAAVGQLNVLINGVTASIKNL